jgi:hypothetical protein
MNHLEEIGVGESNGDVISGSRHHLAAELHFCRITKTVTDRRKMSTDHLLEIGVGESSCGVISDLKRHLAAKIDCSR